jgi:hypothetical protein
MNDQFTFMNDSEHISEDDLEAYHMGIETEMELTKVKKHLLSCEYCLNRLKSAGGYVDNIRLGATAGDLEADAEGHESGRVQAPNKEAGNVD